MPDGIKDILGSSVCCYIHCLKVCLITFINEFVISKATAVIKLNYEYFNYVIRANYIPHFLCLLLLNDKVCMMLI